MMLVARTKLNNQEHLTEPLLEASFPIQTGSVISSVHGYSLYSALKKRIPWFGDCLMTSMSSIAGIKNGKGQIETQEFSRLYIRTPLSKASSLYNLAGQSLSIGQGEILLKIPTIAPLTSKSTLKARIVVIHLFPRERNPSPDKFLAVAIRQLQEREIKGKVSILLRQGALDRKVLIVKGQKNPGYGIQISGLSEEDSLKLKILGLGGRRKMGAGFFA
jgi:CRISPR-associated protein Cas6